MVALISASSCSPTNDGYLTSEDPGTATIRIYKNNNSTSKNRYIAPKNVKISTTHSDLNGLNMSNFTITCPSTGDVKTLIIPVKLPGENGYVTDEHRAQIRRDLNTIFFKENHEENDYPSVSSFIKESSFEKLNISGTILDWFDVEKEAKISSLNGITSSYYGSLENTILPKAIEWAVEAQGIELSDYDSNNDGFVDSIYFVYDRFDNETASEYASLGNADVEITDNAVFTNLTSQNFNLDSTDAVAPSVFSWMSFASIYKNFANRTEDDKNIDFSKFFDSKITAHEFIYHFGSQLGLESLASFSDYNVHPAGKTTMMDLGLCDFDSYSKMTLGWVTPYVVYGTSEILLPKANFADNCVIVIPSNFEEISNKVEYAIKNDKLDEFVFEFNPFSEYLMIDLYTPDGLNYHDSLVDVMKGNKPACTGSGVRIYHVDSRIFKAKVIQSDLGNSFSYTDGYVWDGKKLGNNEILLTPITNSKNENTTYQLPYDFNFFDRLRLLEANKINTFDEGGWMDYVSLFKPNTDPFEIENFGYRFFNARYVFNGGEDLPFRVKVETLKEVNI